MKDSVALIALQRGVDDGNLSVYIDHIKESLINPRIPILEGLVGSWGTSPDPEITTCSEVP